MTPACGSPPSTPTAAQPAEPVEVDWREPVAFDFRERISAHVSVLGVRAGSFDFEVAPSCRGDHPTVELRSKMSTVGLVRFFKATDGIAETTMDPARARPLASELVILDGDVTRRYRALHRPGAVETTFSRTGSPPKHKNVRIAGGEHALDMQSAFLLLRYWRADAGSEGYFYVLLGRSLWRVTVHHFGQKTLELQEQRRPALLLTGVARRLKSSADTGDDTRRFSMWLSPDATRTPLKVEGDASFGKVMMELSAREVDRSEPGICAVLNAKLSRQVNPT